MSDYTPTEDFSVKDGLTTGDPEKIISGADIDGEFDAISTHIATKIDEPSTPATGDLLVYNGSWVAWDIEDFTDEASPATGDKVLVYDLTAGAHRAVTIANLVALHVPSLPAPDFTSTEMTIPTATTFNVEEAHGLGAVPQMFECHLICKTTDAGWAVNDQVKFGFNMGDAVGSYGLHPYANATNVGATVGASGIVLLNKTTGIRAVITAANWKIVIDAWS